MTASLWKSTIQTLGLGRLPILATLALGPDSTCCLQQSALLAGINFNLPDGWAEQELLTTSRSLPESLLKGARRTIA